MSLNNANTSRNSMIQPVFQVMDKPTPEWLNLVSKGIMKRDKLKRGAKQLQDDPSLLFKGLFGKSLLDRHINPFLDRITPDSINVDVLRRNVKFSPHNNFNMTLGAKGGNPNIGINWRF